MRSLKRRVSAAVSARSRAKKLAWLLDRIEPGSRVLLVGVSVDAGMGVNNLIEKAVADVTEATALTYDQEGDPRLGCPLVRGDARGLPFPDGSFDYVVSNAVIEHVGGTEGARAMVRESRRVARRAVYHTTPDRRFPIEVHTQLPLLHWLPPRWQTPVFRWAGQAYFPQQVWLFTPRSLRRLDGPVRVSRPSMMTLVGEWPPA